MAVPKKKRSRSKKHMRKAIFTSFLKHKSYNLCQLCNKPKEKIQYCIKKSNCAWKDLNSQPLDS